MAKQLKKYGPKKNPYTWDPITKEKWIDRWEELSAAYNRQRTEKFDLELKLINKDFEISVLKDKLFDWRYWSCSIALMIFIGHILLWAGCFK
jgi:hypothetical protein